MKRPRTTGDEAPGGIPLDLIERCKAGDEAAWAELVEATHRNVYALCLRILGNPDDAAEATQEAYIKVWRGLGGFRGDAKFTTWLYRIASNTAISKHRQRKRRWSRESNTDETALEGLAATGSVEQTAGARLEVAALEAALANLPPHYRDAVVLKDVYGYSIEEISSQLKVSETAVKVRIHRGRKKLREMLFERAADEV